MKSVLKFLIAGSEVTRYHTVTTHVKETVGHHSHGVAMLCLMMDPDASRSLLIAALAHDLSEHLTGDIPSPAKRLYGIGDQVSELENELMNEAGWYMPHLTTAEARTLKLADVAQGAIFCVRELQMGNSKMRTVFDRYMSYAQQMNPAGLELELFKTISAELGGDLV